MKEISSNLQVSAKLYNFVRNICDDADKVLGNLGNLVREFREKNIELLNKRESLQNEIDDFFKQNYNNISTTDVIEKLKELKYIAENNNSNDKVATDGIDTEIWPMAGSQLVVPADKVNMVLNAANARWGSLYNSLYASNIIPEDVVNIEERKAAVIKYTNDFLGKIVQFADDINWNDIEKFSFDMSAKKLIAHSKHGKEVHLTKESAEKFVGITLENERLSSFLLENNGLKAELKLDGDSKIKDVLLESAITYIIDFEDASISAPENKYEAYRILKGILDKTLECEIRGEIRKINEDTEYLDPKTLEKRILKRSSFPLVRDVGPHMICDKNIITVDRAAIPEKILDTFMSSLIGIRYHVAPKMHGAEEVKYNVELWNRINELQGLPKNANKIGIMNEEMRLNAQLRDSVLEAKDIIFFTNTGFLDYTGSFIDLMMYQGAIAPYRNLSAQLYKTSYEIHNVNIGLDLNVPQVGAGMWPALADMAGLLSSKQAQIKGLTDTSWSPSPTAATIHAMAFHISGNVREMQNEYRKAIKAINTEDLFTFPKADLDNLNEEEIIENVDFAIHGLLAYAEPWVRRGIGCSGIKELSGEPLMEDRATARIKAAFVRNWLLHKVITAQQVEDSIIRMAKLVDEQNSDTEGYNALYTELLDEETVIAVQGLVFNLDGLKHSYVEPYLYPANRREKNKKS